MSTTSQENVAFRYLDNRSQNVLWVLHPEGPSVEAFHFGADVSLLSQFNHESEILFPPCTMLSVERRNEDPAQIQIKVKAIEDFRGQGSKKQTALMRRNASKDKTDPPKSKPRRRTWGDGSPFTHSGASLSSPPIASQFDEHAHEHSSPASSPIDLSLPNAAAPSDDSELDAFTRRSNFLRRASTKVLSRVNTATDLVSSSLAATGSSFSTTAGDTASPSWWKRIRKGAKKSDAEVHQSELEMKAINAREQFLRQQRALFAVTIENIPSENGVTTFERIHTVPSFI